MASNIVLVVHRRASAFSLALAIALLANDHERPSNRTDIYSTIRCGPNTSVSRPNKEDSTAASVEVLFCLDQRRHLKT